MEILKKIARLLVVFLSLPVLVVAQTVTYPVPGAGWPNGGPTPKVPTTVNQVVTVSGCSPSGDGTFPSSFTASEFVLPPFRVQGGTYNGGIGGVDWPRIASNFTNPLTVINGVSEASGQANSPAAVTSGTFPATVNSGVGGQETYTASISGVVLSENWIGIIQHYTSSPNGDTTSLIYTYTFTSTFDIVTGTQSFTWNWDANTSANTPSIAPACSSGTTVSEVGSTTFNWSGTSNMCLVNPGDVHVKAAPPYSGQDGKPTTMQAQFTPHDASGNPVRLDDLASACGFVGFDWQQQITNWLSPDLFPALTPTVPVTTPPPFYDPVPGGYTYDPSNTAYPFYYLVDAVVSGSGIVGCTRDIAVKTDYALTMQDCPNDPLLPTNEVLAFVTTLVGVHQSSPVPPSIQPGTASAPFTQWTWESTFNGLTETGGVQSASASPLNPNSGKGGVRITNVNGVQQTSPSVRCNANPSSLWPPNGSTVPITISGQITAGTSAVGTTTFLVTDSQSSTQQTGFVTAQSNGGFSFTVPLVASRAGSIKSGRQYTINVTANDSIGNQGSCSALVVVPHDQGK